MRCKLHVWLAVRRRLWTADRWLHHGLCDQEYETADHLAIRRVFLREAWHAILSRCSLGHVVPASESTLDDWWQVTPARTPKMQHKGFDSAVDALEGADQPHILAVRDGRSPAMQTDHG